MNHLDDKICMVSGATSGIGAVVARELARQGGTVILVGRNEKKCLRQAELIRRTMTDARIEFLVADLSSQREIRRIAEEFKVRYPRLDILVNNAGAYFGHRELSVDGLEMTFALNHLGYFLLTNLLMAHLKESKSARIVNVASSAHHHGRINFEDLQAEHTYERLTAYAQSKLANVLFTYALSRRLTGTHVTVNAVHPGYVATNLGMNVNWLKAKIRNLVKRDMLSPEEGARTVIHLATAPEVEGVNGRYFYQNREIRSSEASYDEAMGERLWSISETLTGLSGQT